MSTTSKQKYIVFLGLDGEDILCTPPAAEIMGRQTNRPYDWDYVPSEPLIGSVYWDVNSNGILYTRTVGDV